MTLTIENHYIWDLVLHCLAHLKVDNDSNLYSNKYIEKIKKAKNEFGIEDTLEHEMAKLHDIYCAKFEKFALINFIPFYANTINELKNILLGIQSFNEEDKQEFVLPLIKILGKENIFYRKYYDEMMINSDSINQRFLSQLKDIICKVKSLSEKISYPIIVYLQLSMTKAGRAFSKDDVFVAAVSYPFSNESVTNSVIQAIHEITHRYTDPLLGTELSMRDDTHMKAEKFVILANFFLYKKYIPQLLEQYCHYFAIKGIKLEDVLEKYPLGSKEVDQIIRFFDL